MLAISSFFGFDHKVLLVINEPTPVISQVPIVIPDVVVETVTPTIKIVISLKPTLSRPKSSISEEILKTFFGMSDKNQISKVLSDTDQLRAYEQNYYQKYQKLPIPRLVIDLKKLYGMPSNNGTVICTGSQLKALYDEIEITEKQVAYENMDRDCHSGDGKSYPDRKYDAESKECQDWRRDHDQDRVQPTGSLEQQISELTKKMSERKNLYDKLLEKYCKI